MHEQARERFQKVDRARLKAVGQTCRTAAGAGADSGKRGVVYFVTSDKVIQAVMTASAFAVLASGLETVGLAVQAVTGLPLAPIEFVMMIGVFYVALWADNHTDEWRELVERTTGQAAAEDS